MRVIVVFEFEGVDPNSEQADQIVDEIGKSCEVMRKDFGANACYVDDCEESNHG
jgi:hypothetical protein